MKKTFVVIILFFLAYSFSYSQDSKSSIKTIKSAETNDKYQKRQELQNKIVYNDNRISPKDSVINNPQEDKENPNKKSVFLGGVLSGIIPGAGEFYAKTYLKGAVFLAAEVGLWVAYTIYQKKGDHQTDFYQNYANQNWNMRKYAAWLQAQGFPKASDINLNSPDDVLRAQINACEEVNFSHTLPPSGEQQYYEVIGKYQNFISGWSTADPNAITKNNYLDYKMPQVDQYMWDRQRANTFYNDGSLMLTGVIINHLLSIADGAWSVVRYNNRLDLKTNINVQGEYSFIMQKTVLVPHLNVSFIF
jgi:TM2 domain-containing membrane protein YozV